MRHLYAGGRVTGGLAKPSEHREVGIQVSSPGVVRQHHGGLRQVGQTGEREACILEHAEVGHGHEVVVAAQVQGRFRVHAAAHVVDDDVAALALFDVIEHVAQLQTRLQGHRVQRQAHTNFAGQAVVGLQRAEHTAVEFVLGRQVARLNQPVVEADNERRVGGFLLRGVAVFEVQRCAFVAPGEQVWREIQRHGDLAGVVAGDIQLLGRNQLTQLDRTIGGQPVRCIVRLAWLHVVEMVDYHAAARQRLTAQHQRRRGALEFRPVATGDHQQFAVRIIGVAHQRQGRPCRRRQRQTTELQCIRTTEQHHGIAAGRQLVEARGKHRAAIAGLGAEPRRQCAGGFQGVVVGCSGKHKRQAQLTRIPTVEKRQWQDRQIVRQGQWRHLDVELTVVADPGPQAGVLRVFATHRIVADELQAQTVELGDQVSGNLHHLLLHRPGVFLGQ
ncbi:hypothetical protein D3C84_581520 [compost metagenome]